MSFTLIAITAKYIRPSGVRAAGSVTFAPSAVMVDSSTNEMRAPVPVVGVLDATGTISVSLTATNDPTTTPVGCTYLVTEKIFGAIERSYSIDVPYNGGAIDLADVSPVTNPSIGIPDGTVAAPSVRFASEPTSGLYRIGAGILGWAILGVERLRLSATELLVSASVSIKGPRPWADVNAYGADRTGVSDSTAAIQAAIDATDSAAAGGRKGGQVLLTGNYLCASSLNCDQTYGLQLLGVTGPSALGGAAASATLTFTGTGAGSFVSARSSTGFNLKNLRILYSSGSFTGTLVDLGWVASDTSLALVENCELRSTASTIRTAGRLISLHRANSNVIRNCQFSWAAVGVDGKLAGANYSNANQIENCEFLQMDVMPITNAHEAWLIKACTFEPLFAGGPGAYSETNGAFGPTTFLSCWFGDAGGSNPWITYKGNGLGLYNNMMAGGTGILLGGTTAVEGVTLMNNYFTSNPVIQTTGSAQINGFSAFGNKSTATWITDGGNLLTIRNQLGNTDPNRLSAPIDIPNAFKIAYLAALPGSATNHSIGGATGLGGAHEENALTYITRADASYAGNVPHEFWTGDTTPALALKIKNNGVTSLVALRVAAVAGLGYATGAGGAVTQITSSATAVTLNKPTGQITTVALTTAAGAEERFTVNNTQVAATDTISVGTTYNGGGTPAVTVLKVGANLFDIVITNLHATNALDALMVINFAVIKAVAS